MALVANRSSAAGEVITSLGPARFAKRLAVALFPATSVTRTTIVFVPGCNGTLQLKFPTATDAMELLHEMLAIPESASLDNPATATLPVVNELPSAGLVILTSGGV